MRFSVIILLSILIIESGCKENSTEPKIHDIDSNVVVRKPNLYIYPDNEIDLQVQINFPLGGELIKSNPEYNDGWNIKVEPDGIINKEYRYLFYEYIVPDYHQHEFGWIIGNENLEDFFRENMAKSGFNEMEIDDFIEFWIPELTDYPFYAIYPQYRNTLDVMTEIIFSIKPDNFYRLQYLIKGSKSEIQDIEIPSLIKAERNGYHAVEWGVIIK